MAQLNSEITNCRDQNCSGKSAMTRKAVIFFISRLCNSRKTSKWTHLGLFHPTIYNPPRHNFRSEFPSLSENTPQPFFQIFIASPVSLSDVQTANWPCLTSEPAHTHTPNHSLSLSVSSFLSLHIYVQRVYAYLCWSGAISLLDDSVLELGFLVWGLGLWRN